MKPKFSVLGLALLAALAFGALAAQAASAATHHITADEEWTPTVSAKSGHVLEFTTGEEKGFECAKVSATATEGSIAATTESVTVTPKYEECHAFEPGNPNAATLFINAEDCDYRFEGATTEGNPTGGEHASVQITNHVEPEEPCHIEFRATVFQFKCASVPNQEIEDAVRYEQGAEDIVIKATAHGFKSTTTNSFACPTESGGTEEHTNGSYTGEVTVKAHNSGGEALGLTLTENAT